MLGPDWLVEVTDLVSDFMRVGDPRVAHMVDSSTLAGLEPGTTPFKVGLGASEHKGTLSGASALEPTPVSPRVTSFSPVFYLTFQKPRSNIFSFLLVRFSG